MRLIEKLLWPSREPSAKQEMIWVVAVMHRGALSEALQRFWGV